MDVCLTAYLLAVRVVPLAVLLGEARLEIRTALVGPGGVHVQTEHVAVATILALRQEFEDSLEVVLAVGGTRGIVAT